MATMGPRAIPTAIQGGVLLLMKMGGTVLNVVTRVDFLGPVYAILLYPAPISGLCNSFIV